MNQGSGGGGGSGGSSGVAGLSADAFIADDGSVDYVRLATTLVGGAMMVYSVGTAAIVDAVIGLAVGGIDWIAGFGSGLLKHGFGIIIASGTAAWEAATALVRATSGLWVPVLVLALALGYLYLVGWWNE